MVDGQPISHLFCVDPKSVLAELYIKALKQKPVYSGRQAGVRQLMVLSDSNRFQEPYLKSPTQPLGLSV